MTVDDKIEEIKNQILNLKLDFEKTDDFDKQLKIKEKILKLETEELRLIKEEMYPPQTETMLDLIERNKNKAPLKKYEIGVKAIDENMGGFCEATFINIAGNNFAGKTTLVIQAIKTLSKYQKVMFFSYEMYEGLISRKFKDLSTEQLKNIEVEQINSHIEYIEKTIRIKAREGIKAFFIDSRMKIQAEGDEYQKNSYISAKLSKLVQELGIFIVLINQIATTDIRNGRLALKGSGDQEYDSDVILYIVYNEKEQTRTIICKKDRINERLWQDDYVLMPVIEYTVDMPFVDN